MIRNSVLQSFGDLPVSEFRRSFPEANVAGCVFHFTKALNAKKDELGLMVQYLQINEVKVWIRRLIGLCMLPEWLVPLVADDLLRNAPVTGDQATDQALQAFATYFRGFWLNPALIPIWNSHSNLGPRTTNHAEGWHSALQFKFKNRHPDLGEWLAEMQK